MTPETSGLRDVDLLLGRDNTTGVRVGADELQQWVDAAGLGGGLLGSQRAAQFDLASGNAEVDACAAGLGLNATLTLETRDWPGSRDAVLAAPEGCVVRLVPQRQDCQPTYPGFRALVRLLADRFCLVLTEGDLRIWGPAYTGLGLRVVFLDAHFYHLGDLVALAADEEGFHASTRLLAGPDSFDVLRAELGIDRLVFGSRAGFHEGLSALERLSTATLDDSERTAVRSGNLLRLLREGAAR